MLHGFNEKLAQRYLIENCFRKTIMCTVQDLEPDERALVERMLSVVSQENGRANLLSSAPVADGGFVLLEITGNAGCKRNTGCV